MAVFKALGRDWVVKLDAPIIREIRKELEIDPIASSTPEKLEEDFVLLVDMLWVICRAQAQQAGFTDRQFGEALVGDAIAEATRALTEAIIDFFPERKRLLLRGLAEKNAAIRQKGIELAWAKINDPALTSSLEAAMERRMNQELEQVLMELNSATSTPASAESAPPG